jgi:hypothetical protein
MAGFTADLNPKSNAMSLADIMKAGAYSAEMDVLNRQAAVAREKEKELPVVTGFLNDPKNKNERGEWDLDKVNTILPTIAPVTGAEYAKKITDGVANHAAATKAKMELSNTARGYMASLYGSYAQGGSQDPREVAAGMSKLAETMPELRPYVEPALRNLQNVPPGPKFTESLFKARDEFLTPTQQIDQFTPKVTTGEVGGQAVGVVTQPSFRGSQPTVSTSPLGGGQQPTTQPTTGGQPTSIPSMPKTRVLPDLIKEDPDFNYTGPANPLNLNDLQRDSYKKGKTMLQEAPILATAAEEGKQYVRKVEEVANKASGSGVYKTAQDWAKVLVAQPDLDTLRKNIAGVMVQNANTMGLNKTDSSRGDAATISGSDAISPEALRDIMQRADAQFTATTKFAEGLKNYREKRGEVNSAINADKFQSAWASNYDSRIFQLQNIRDSNYPEAVKKQRYESITKSMSEKEFDELDKKAKAIDRLVKGSYK